MPAWRKTWLVACHTAGKSSTSVPDQSRIMFRSTSESYRRGPVWQTPRGRFSGATRGRVFAREERGDFGDGVATGEAAPAGGRKAIGRTGEAQLLKDFTGRRRQERPEQNRQHAADFGQVVKHLVEPGGLARVFRQFEGGRLIDVLISAVDQAPDALERGLPWMFLELPS